MPWWIWPVMAGVVGLALLVIRAQVGSTKRRRDRHSHRKPRDPHQALADWGCRYERGSMTLDDELRLWGPQPWAGDSGTGAGGLWEDRTALINGHTFGCLVPDEEHPGACPENGDGPDDYDWPVPFLPAPGPVAGGPAVVAAALASAEEDPAGAGWTDKLLADLREAPTVLDGDEWDDDTGPDPDRYARHAELSGAYEAEDHERLADTGEIQLAGLRADWADELADQDADAEEFISRLKSDAAAFQLSAEKR